MQDETHRRDRATAEALACRGWDDLTASPVSRTHNPPALQNAWEPWPVSPSLAATPYFASREERPRLNSCCANHPALDTRPNDPASAAADWDPPPRALHPPHPIQRLPLPPPFAQRTAGRVGVEADAGSTLPRQPRCDLTNPSPRSRGGRTRARAEATPFSFLAKPRQREHQLAEGIAAHFEISILVERCAGRRQQHHRLRR